MLSQKRYAAPRPTPLLAQAMCVTSNNTNVVQNSGLDNFKSVSVWLVVPCVEGKKTQTPLVSVLATVLGKCVLKDALLEITP